MCGIVVVSLVLIVQIPTVVDTCIVLVCCIIRDTSRLNKTQVFVCTISNSRAVYGRMRRMLVHDATD